MRAAELAIGFTDERPLTLDFGKRLDAVVATMLLEHTAGQPVADPVQVIEALVRISAGVAIVTGRSKEWFRDCALDIYNDEQRARDGARNEAARSR